MKTHALHQAAERISRARSITIREARSLLSQRGHAERKRQRAQAERVPEPPPRAWWNREPDFYLTENE